MEKGSSMAGVKPNLMKTIIKMSCNLAGFRKTCFKKAQPTGSFWLSLGFGLNCFFWIFYVNKQLGSLLVDLAYQVNFYLDFPVLQIIQKSANSLLVGMLVIRSCKHKEIGFLLGFSTGFTHKKPPQFGVKRTWFFCRVRMMLVVMPNSVVSCVISASVVSGGKPRR